MLGDRTPRASRPFMPGYGIAPAGAGQGLLPWSWAVERLHGSHDYWLATTWPDGAPHVMPVWGVWRDGALWFSSGLRSRKARNLASDCRCVLTTDDARHPVVVTGDAARVVELDEVAAFAGAINAKYGTDIPVEFYDPATNGVWNVVPARVFGMDSDDFIGTPTRWQP